MSNGVDVAVLVGAGVGMGVGMGVVVGCGVAVGARVLVGARTVKLLGVGVGSSVWQARANHSVQIAKHAMPTRKSSFVFNGSPV